MLSQPNPLSISNTFIARVYRRCRAEFKVIGRSDWDCKLYKKVEGIFRITAHKHIITEL